MPIIQIKALPQKSGLDINKILKTLTAEVSKATKIPLNNLWATWETLTSQLYIEGETSSSLQPFNSHPPLVNVISFEGKSIDIQEAIMTTVGRVLTRELQIDQGNCFIVYDEVKAGKVFVGGEILRGKN